MADLSTILVDGRDVDMAALRSWLTTLAGSISLAALGIPTLDAVSDLPTPPGDSDSKTVFVNNDPDSDNNTIWTYPVGGPWRKFTEFYDGMATVVQPLVDEAKAWAQSDTNPDPDDTTSQSAKTWATAAETAASTISGAAASIQAWSQPASSVVTTGQYFLRAGGVTSNAGYKTLLYQVTGSETGFRATARTGPSVSALAIFYSTADGSGTPLGYYQIGDLTTHTQAVFTPPTGTVSIGISGSASSTYPFVFEVKGYIDGNTLTSQSFAAYRISTRAALLAAGSIPAGYGNVLECYGNATQGDTPPHRYVRGGTIYPTGTGWGLQVQDTTASGAFGILTNQDETAAADTEIMTDLRPTGIAQNQNVDESYIENWLTLPTSGLYTINLRDAQRLHYASLSNGQSIEVDVSRIPINQTLRFYVAPNGSTGRMVLDAGWQDGTPNVWPETGTRYLVINPGWSVTIMRHELTDFVVTHAVTLATSPRPAPSGLTDATYTRVVRAASMAFAGQSIYDLGFGRGAAHGAFLTRLAALKAAGSSASVPDTTDCWDISYGGSAVCQYDIDASAPTNYWVDMSDPANPADGPLLTSAIAVITARGGDANQPALSYILDNLGYQSSIYVSTTANPNPAFTVDMFKTAMAYRWQRLRAAAGNANLPIGMSPIGRRTANAAGGMQVIREAQQQLVAADANCFTGAELWDLLLRDTVHPTGWSYNQLGTRDAEEVARVIYGSTDTTIYTHPTVSTAAVVSGSNAINVTIQGGELNSRVYRVPNPYGFTVFDASGNQMTISRIHWYQSDLSDPTHPKALLRIFLTADPTGGTLYHMYDYGASFDATRVIRTWAGRGGKPVRPAKLAL